MIPKQGENTFFTIRSYLATMHEHHASVLNCSLASSKAILRSLGWLSELSNTVFSLAKLASNPINTDAKGYSINIKKLESIHCKNAKSLLAGCVSGNTQTAPNVLPNKGMTQRS